MAQKFISAAVVAAALCIPTGAFLGFYTGNGLWFLLCAPLLFFMS